MCHLRSVDYGLWELSERGLQRAQSSQFSRQMWASSWLVTLAVWKFCWYYCESSQNCCCLPTAEGPTKFGLLQSSQGCSHCGIAVDRLKVFFLLPWRCTRGAVCDFLANSSHIVAITNLFCSSCHHVVAIPIPFCGSCHHVVAIANLVLNSSHHVVAVACLFVNSCHHVVAFFWARVLCHLTAEEVRFRMRIILGVVLIRSLA